MKGFEQSEVYSILISCGVDDHTATHCTSILCKWDAPNYCPESEVRDYLKFFREILDSDYHRQWSRHTYSSAFYMWENLSKIWDYRKSLPRHRRV